MTIATRYVAVVRKASASDFGIHFPDLPGCVTTGRTMQVARRLAAEVLALHLDALAAKGRPLPPARDLAAIRDDPACQNATTLILVEAPPRTT
jgi:predicted RNase H-like HicB family nuclease